MVRDEAEKEMRRWILFLILVVVAGLVGRAYAQTPTPISANMCRDNYSDKVTWDSPMDQINFSADYLIQEVDVSTDEGCFSNPLTNVAIPSKIEKDCYSIDINTGFNVLVKENPDCVIKSTSFFEVPTTVEAEDRNTMVMPRYTESTIFYFLLVFFGVFVVGLLFLARVLLRDNKE